MERERSPEKRELVKEVKEVEEKSEESEITRRMLERFFKGKEGRFFDMYKLLSEKEREKIKRDIKDSELSKQKKKESLRSLEASDREAVAWWERIKGSFRELTKEGLKKWEKTMEISEKEVGAARKAVAELTEKEIKIGKLPPTERLIAWAEEMGTEELQKWEGRTKRLEEVEIIEGPEKDILEAVERKKRKEAIPIFVEFQGRLEELERIRVEEIPSERGLIEKYKSTFIKNDLGKGAREEEVDYKELGHKRYKEAMEEAKRERR